MIPFDRALLQAQSITIIYNVTFRIMLSINLQLDLGILFDNAKPDTTIAEIRAWAHVNPIDIL
jgi:hypothetical protein